MIGQMSTAIALTGFNNLGRWSGGRGHGARVQFPPKQPFLNVSFFKNLLVTSQNIIPLVH